MLSVVLACLNAFAGLVLYVFGKRHERATVLTTIVYVALPPVIYSLQYGSFRYGIFALELMLLAAFVITAIKTDRWWPILAAGAQILTCTTHFATFNPSDYHVWGAVTVRVGLWTVVTTILLLGAWETWARHIVVSRGLTLGVKMEV